MKRQFVLSALAVLLTATWASAGPVYNFYNITNNGNAQIGGQLSVEVDPIGTTGVNFKFVNAGPIASKVAEIYFADGSLFAAPASGTIYQDPGVKFRAPTANPPSLPGAPGGWSQIFAADADITPPNGGPGDEIDVGEYLNVPLSLLPGVDYQDVLDAIGIYATNPNPPQPSLRIGLHVRSIGLVGGSDSYINTTIIPLPAAAWMGMALMGSVGGLSYFRKRRYLA